MELNIVICDDDKKFLSRLRKKIEPLTVDASIIEFYDGAELVKYCKTNIAEIILLDIDMPQLDGFSAADRIQLAKPDAQIIFITSHSELAYQAYDYRPFWFVAKSDLDKIDYVLSRCIKLVEQKRKIPKRVITVSDAEVEINLDDIMYLESDRHYINARSASGGDLKFRGKLDEAYHQLKDCGFVKIQRAYIVNCRYISRLTAHTVILKNGGEFTVTRNKEKQKEIALLFGRFMRELR